MVRFEKNKVIIEIPGYGSPVETWLLLHESLCDIMRFINSDSISDDSFCAAMDFLSQLTPEWETARKMLE